MTRPINPKHLWFRPVPTSQEKIAMDERRRHLAYVAGKKAALAWKSKSSCNRQRGTIFDDWHDGYDEGAREREA